MRVRSASWLLSKERYESRRVYSLPLVEDINEIKSQRTEKRQHPIAYCGTNFYFAEQSRASSHADVANPNQLIRRQVLSKLLVPSAAA